MVDVTIVGDDLPLDGRAFNDGWGCRRGRRRRTGAWRRALLSLHHDADAFTVRLGCGGPRPPPLDDTGVNVYAQIPLRRRRGRPIRDNVSRAGSDGEGPRRRTETPGAFDITLPDKSLGLGARTAGSSPINSLDLTATQHQGPGLGPPVVLAHKMGDAITNAGVEIIIMFPNSDPGPTPRLVVSVVQVAATSAAVRHGEDEDGLLSYFQKNLLVLKNDRLSSWW